MDYMNTKLSNEKRAELLLEKMTIKEKAAQMIQLAYTKESENWAENGIGSFINAYDEDVVKLQKIAVEKSRLHIPILFSIDCIHGHALNSGATVFPSQLAMAQSFDRESLRKCALVSGTEALTDGIPWVLSPVLCAGRDPRWGRIGETFGEDTYLIGELGAAMVKGYNEAGVMCCPKHYIAHGEVSGGRDSYEVQSSDRKIKEVFDPPFVKAIEAGCTSIMTAQHIHDGQPFCSNKSLVNGLLKEEDGFDGIVITDNSTSLSPFEYGTAATTAESFKSAVECGNDMLMFCAKSSEFYEEAEKICEADPEFEEKMNIAVLRILTVKFRMGLFENPYRNCEKSLLGCNDHIEEALKISEKCITLLKNEKEILPLKLGKINSIAVIGPAADNRYSQYGDWTYLNIPFSVNKHIDGTGKFVSFLDGITKRASKEGIDVRYCKGCEIVDETNNEISKAADIANKSDIIVAVVGDINVQNGEHHDRCHLGLSGLQNRLIDALLKTGKPVIAVLSNGRPLCTPVIADKCAGVIQVFNAGIVGGTALSEILFGDVNPSGKLPVTIARCEGQLPYNYNFTLGWHGDKYIDEGMEPLYHFGFGLSYSNYKYSNLLVPEKISINLKKFEVSVSVTNTGTISGEEIVQLYVYQKQTGVLQPLKALKGFERIYLESGQSKNVTITVNMRDLEIVNFDLVREIQPGQIKIMVGSSSRDCDLLAAESEIIL